MLNRIWASFFLVGFLAAAGKSIFAGDTSVWAAMVQSAFEMAKTAFEIALGLTGMMCLWLGIMRMGEQGARSMSWRGSPGRSCAGSFRASRRATRPWAPW